MKKIIGVRKKYKVFGRGSLEFLKPENIGVLAYIRSYEEQNVLCIANLSRTAEFVELNLSKYAGKFLLELFTGKIFPEIKDNNYILTMQPHSFFWFEIK